MLPNKLPPDQSFPSQVVHRIPLPRKDQAPDQSREGLQIEHSRSCRPGQVSGHSPFTTPKGSVIRHPTITIDAMAGRRVNQERLAQNRSGFDLNQGKRF